MTAGGPKARRYPRVITSDRAVIGWREWVSLPDLHTKGIKAKVDTGARSSALHAYDVEIFTRRGKRMVRFKVHPIQREARPSIEAEAELLELRRVKSSGGHESLRPVILTSIELLGQRWPIELTLASRDAMGFRMLLGREAIRGRMVVDPGRSYYGGKPPKKKKKKKKKKPA
jgi:hypothetical protein